MFEKAKKGISFPMEAIMKVYPLLDTLSLEEEGFYAVINFFLFYMSFLFLIMFISCQLVFANTDDSADSRRVQSIQYVNANYKESIRLKDLADLVGMSPSLKSFF